MQIFPFLTKSRKCSSRHIEDSCDLIQAALSIDDPHLRLSVNPSHLRMQGGWIYDSTHPFVAGLSRGVSAIENFYKYIRPDHLGELYSLASNSLLKKLPAWEIPWYDRLDRTPPRGEKGLDSSHGVSFYGPCTREKVDLEYSRLTKLKESISREGYRPDLYGDIEGYILTDGSQTAFFVRGGKHRAAVLTELNYARITVAFKRGFPRVVDSRWCRYWPLVRDGSLNESNAMKVFMTHLNGRRFEIGP